MFSAINLHCTLHIAIQHARDTIILHNTIYNFIFTNIHF